MSDLAEQRRAAIAALETKTAGLVAGIESLERDVERLARKAKNEEDRAIGLGEERDMLLKEMRSIEQLMASTQARFEIERQRSAGLQITLDDQRRLVDETLIGQRETQKAIDAAQRAKEAAERQAADAAARLAAHSDNARAAGKANADQIEALKAEIGVLKGALETARAAQSGGRQDDSGLREAIAEIGAQVARMANNEVRL
jgi:chromosome segregation ATPase